MRKKTIVLVSSLVAALAIGVTTFSLKKSFFVAKGQTDTYTFTLNAANAPATYGNNVEVVATALGNSLKFNYVGAASYSGNHAALADGGYIQNVDKLMDLVSLSVAGTGTFKLHTGFEGYENVKTFTIDSAQEITALSNVSYFKLEAVGAAVVNNLTGEVNCQETPGRDLEPGEVGSTLMYDVCKWNRLVHDIDTSKDFTYTVSFRQIIEETNYLKRPAFFVYPAEYDENDVIPHTGTSHYFNGTGGYLHIRQTNSQLCNKKYYNTDKGICNADAWIDDHVVGTKEATIGGLYGLPGEEADQTSQSRITRNCIITVTFSLQNLYENEIRYQHWFVKVDCQSFAVIEEIDYSGNYSKTYTLDTTVENGGGNICPCERIGIAIGHGYEGTFKILSASSTGVR